MMFDKNDQYDGKITKIHNKGSGRVLYDILFEDGDIEINVSPRTNLISKNIEHTAMVAIGVPLNAQQALLDKDWRDSMMNELKAHVQYGTFKCVPISKGTDIKRTIWNFTTKSDGRKNQDYVLWEIDRLKEWTSTSQLAQ